MNLGPWIPRCGPEGAVEAVSFRLFYVFGLFPFRRGDRFFERFVFGNRFPEKVPCAEQVQLVFSFLGQIFQLRLFVIRFQSLFHHAFETRFFMTAQAFVTLFLLVGEGELETVEFTLGLVPCLFFVVFLFPTDTGGPFQGHVVYFLGFLAFGSGWGSSW